MECLGEMRQAVIGRTQTEAPMCCMGFQFVWSVKEYKCLEMCVYRRANNFLRFASQEVTPWHGEMPYRNNMELIESIEGLTSLKKSPTYLAGMRVRRMGRPRRTFPLASTRTTVRLAVIRTIPPNWAAAPMKANLLGSGKMPGLA